MPSGKLSTHRLTIVASFVQVVGLSDHGADGLEDGSSSSISCGQFQMTASRPKPAAWACVGLHRRYFVRPPAPTSVGMSLAQLLHRVRRWACTVVHACSLLHTVLETSWRASRASSRTVAATLATLSLHSNQDVSAFLCYERPDSKTRSLSVPVHSATVSVDFRECGAARPRGCHLTLPRPSLHGLSFKLHSFFFNDTAVACTRNLRINKLENQDSKQPATKVCGASCGSVALSCA